MGELSDLTLLICERLDIAEQNQVRCIRNIIGDTIAFSDYRRDNLNEDRLDKLIKVVSGFISEIKAITDDPMNYWKRLEELRLLIKNKGI